MFDSIKACRFYGLKAAESEDRSCERRNSRAFVDKAIYPSGSIHRSQQVSRFVLQESAIILTDFDKRLAWNENSVEKAFQNGRHRTPPRREHDHHMICV